MNFSKTTSYALNVLSYMSQNENALMSASYLHNELNIPYAYLRTLLTLLARNNIIISTKGRNGGYKLGRHKSEIFLSDIIDATEGMESFSRCVMGFEKCPFNFGCFIHPVWIRIRTDILALLKGTSLADLLPETKFQ